MSKYDEVFEMVVTKFFDKAIFSQRVNIVKSSTNFKIQGNIEFMTCDDTRCTYEPENNFIIDYDPNSGLKVSDTSKIKQGEVDLNSNISLYEIILTSIFSIRLLPENNNLSEDIKKASSFWNIFGLGFFDFLRY